MFDGVGEPRVSGGLHDSKKVSLFTFNCKGCCCRFLFRVGYFCEGGGGGDEENGKNK